MPPLVQGIPNVPTTTRLLTCQAWHQGIAGWLFCRRRGLDHSHHGEQKHAHMQSKLEQSSGRRTRPLNALEVLQAPRGKAGAWQGDLDF
eukprot:6461705-Amphidinium_carterae.1